MQLLLESNPIIFKTFMIAFVVDMKTHTCHISQKRHTSTYIGNACW